MTNHAKRLERLESSHPAERNLLTYDEINIRLMELADSTEAKVIRADIVSTAKKQASPDYATHREWLRAMWFKRTKRYDYEHCLTGGGMGEYQDWDLPNVMQRRSALRKRDVVQAALSLKNNQRISKRLHA